MKTFINYLESYRVPSPSEADGAVQLWRFAKDMLSHFGNDINKAMAALAVNDLNVESPQKVGSNLGICLAYITQSANQTSNFSPLVTPNPMKVFEFLKGSREGMSIIAPAQQAYAMFDQKEV